MSLKRMYFGSAMIIVRRANARRSDKEQVDPYSIVSPWKAGALFGELVPKNRVEIILAIGVKNFLTLSQAGKSQPK